MSTFHFNLLLPRWIKQQYTAILQTEKFSDADAEEKQRLHDSENSNSDQPWLQNQQSLGPRRWSAQSWLLCINMAFFGLTSVIFVSTLAIQPHGRNALLKENSFYSPLLDRFDIPTIDTQINGTLFAGSNPALSRQNPSPEVEAFWYQFEPIHLYKLSADDIRRMGKDPATATRFPEFMGFGEDAYMAKLDVLHQIHCLDSLRKVVFQDWEAYPTELVMTQPRLYWPHMSHCIDILYQNLKCHASMDLITFNWKETQTHPFPDFNVFHQCRDWDTIMDYHFEHSIPMTEELWDQFIRPTDESKYTEVPQEPQYFDYFPGEKPQI